MVLKTGVVLGSLLLGYASLVMPVSAHEHEDEHEAVVTSATGVTADIAQMEQLVSLMEQLILLLSALHIQQGYAPVHTTPAVDAHADMDEHHDEHSHTDTTAEAPVSHLVIELETHHNETHVHVRYTDKPEDMFFVTAPITDEDGIVTAVQTRTGLSAETIRAALKYME